MVQFKRTTDQVYEAVEDLTASSLLWPSNKSGRKKVVRASRDDTLAIISA